MPEGATAPVLSKFNETDHVARKTKIKNLFRSGQQFETITWYSMIERLLAMLSADLDDPDMIEHVNHLEWQIHFEDDISVELRCLDGNLLLQVLVIDISRPSTNQLIDILSANCLGLGTLGNVFCFDRKGTTLLLTRLEPISIAYRVFLEALKDCVSATSFWRQRLG